MTTTYRPLLDILTEGLTLPEGCDRWGMRSVRPDFTSSRDFRWPYPGGVAEAPGPIITSNHGGYPEAVGDGICTAITAQGMASGGIPAITVLITAHAAADVLGAADEIKVRVRRAAVVEVVDLPGMARAGKLNGANLYGANLRGADLYGVNLCGANLSGANLSGANLYGADLYGANLRGADLYGANLSGADLRGADLYGADLCGANLYGANLSGADLYGANADQYTRWPEGFNPATAGAS